MRFIQQFIYEPKDICSSRKRQLCNKPLWQLGMEDFPNLNKPKVPKLDARADKKIKENSSMANILEKLVDKIGCLADAGNKTDNVINQTKNTNQRNSKEFYIRFFDKKLKQLSQTKREQCFDAMFDEIQKYLK